MTKLFKTTEQAKKEQEQTERKTRDMKNKWMKDDWHRTPYGYEQDPEKRKQCEREYNTFIRELKRQEERNKNIYDQYRELRYKSSELDEHFVEYLSGLKNTKSVEVETDNFIVDEAKYNNYARELETQYSNLVKELCDLQVDPNNCTMQTVMDLQRKRARITAEAENIKREWHTLNPDDERFKMKERVKIDITPMDAYLTFKELSNEQDSVQDEWKQKVVMHIRAEDVRRVLLVSDEDWVAVRPMYNLLSQFLKNAEWKPIMTTVLAYETKKDYLNREITDNEISRDSSKFVEKLDFGVLFDYNNKQLIQSILYLTQLYNNYKVYLENKKIAEDIKSMKDGLEKKSKKSKKSNNKTDEV